MSNQSLLTYTDNEKYLTSALFNHFETIENYEFTTGNVCYDVIVNLKNGTKIMGEIKVRDFELDKYPDYILQVDKLINLGKRAKELGFHKIYYINFFKTQTPAIKEFIIFNLSARIKLWKVTPPIVQEKYMNAATFQSKSYKVPKKVIMLKYEEEMDSKGTLSLN